MACHTKMICQICTCLIFALVPVFVFGQTENQNSSQDELFVDYIFPRTNLPVDNPPPLFEEFFSKNGEAYLYGHHRGHGLKLVLADSLVTLAGIPVYPSITAHKGPVIPAPTAVISHQFGDFQREAWAKGESIETIHENAYRFLLSFALVDSVCRMPSHGSKNKWEVWYKGQSGPSNLWVYDSMPPPEKTISPARKLRARRQTARNSFNEIRLLSRICG